MKKKAAAWIIIGVTLIAITPFLAESWFADDSFIKNITQQDMIIGEISLRWPILLGLLAIASGIYQLFKERG